MPLPVALGALGSVLARAMSKRFVKMARNKVLQKKGKITKPDLKRRNKTERKSGNKIESDLPRKVASKRLDKFSKSHDGRQSAAGSTARAELKKQASKGMRKSSAQQSTNVKKAAKKIFQNRQAKSEAKQSDKLSNSGLQKVLKNIASRNKNK